MEQPIDASSSGGLFEKATRYVGIFPSSKSSTYSKMVALQKTPFKSKSQVFTPAFKKKVFPRPPKDVLGPQPESKLAEVKEKLTKAQKEHQQLFDEETKLHNQQTENRVILASLENTGEEKIDYDQIKTLLSDGKFLHVYHSSLFLHCADPTEWAGHHPGASR
ncbi:unnamed protein product [Anisakis simplex]|uniref:TPX2 domain-containing protein n=1 Tax=Anisakis simplex TaxID=6269 RepID=A0A0M3J312_ANISI|nr:unnamed protein product [Anisakis simplex]